LVFKNTVMFARAVAGTEPSELSVIGVPPVQFSTMSPTNSVKPSERRAGGTAAAEEQVIAPDVTCALAVSLNLSL
jgi:hypothetical protein